MADRRRYLLGREISRPRVYGNFRTPEWARDKKPAWQRHRERRAKSENNSAAHLANLRRLPCAMCGAAPHKTTIDPHHLRGRCWTRGIGQRPPDCDAIPLCRACHQDVQRVPGRRETDYIKAVAGVDALHLADSLWIKHKDGGVLGDYVRVVVAFGLEQAVIELRRARRERRKPAAGRRPRVAVDKTTS